MSFVFAQNDHVELTLQPHLINRHGLITGATGTGKTISLQTMAEGFSNLGIPVFMADVKGDLSGVAVPGIPNEKLIKILTSRNLPQPNPQAFPVILWDVFGKYGHPVRATISDMGPLMLSRLLNLNDVQTGVLQLIFKIADDQGLLLLDLKDLRAMVQHVGENASNFQTEYGNISVASVGAIQRGLLSLEQEAGTQFFGEPMLNIDDLLQNIDGKGVISVLAAERLMASPRIYSVFLLWLLSELFERLPEVGDLPKPKIVFFFDEAHLLFNDAPSILLEKIEQLVRLIRSKGVGVYFVSQNPLDIPDKVLAQLSNRVQHALRAFTPRDQKAVKVAAETLRANPKINAEVAITELAVGEALVSFLDEKGVPTMVERAFVRAPSSQIGPLTEADRLQVIEGSLVFGRYEKNIDRESAYERLKGKIIKSSQPSTMVESKPSSQSSEENSSWGGIGQTLGGLVNGAMGGSRGSTSNRQGIGETLVKTMVRTIGSEVGRRIIRGMMGSLRR